MKKPISIVVGGGVAGIFSALLLAKRGHDVSLIEKEGKLGGLLGSSASPEGDAFDYGTHYLLGTGNHEVDSLLFSEEWRAQWVALPHLKAANVFAGELNPKSMFPDARKLTGALYEKGVAEILAIREPFTKAKNLEENLRGNFGATFTNYIFRPLVEARLGLTLEELYVNSHLLLNVTRIIAGTPEQAREWKKNPVFDAKLAFHSYEEGTRPTISYYPKRGGNKEWIDLLEEKLRAFGVKILKSENLQKIEYENGRIKSVQLRTGKRELDHLFWTLPVGGFLKAADLPAIMSPPSVRITSHFHYVLDRPPITDAHYVLNNDAKMISFRTTFYSNVQQEYAAQRKRFNLTVEVLSGKFDDYEARSREILRELIQCEIIAPDANVLWKSGQSGVTGVPILTPKFVEESQRQIDSLQNQFQNISFLGTVPGRSFFKKEVLMSCYHAINSLK